MGRGAVGGDQLNSPGVLIEGYAGSLRPGGDEVFPEYLVHYLNSPEVHMWITSESRGSTAIPHISAATLRELVIPLPSVAVQRDIAAMMDSINIHIEQHQRGASTMQSLRDLVFPSLMQS